MSEEREPEARGEVRDEVRGERRDEVRGERRDEVRPEHVRAVRLGHGANCSSVGSVIDTLFVVATVGGAILAAVCAAMADEPVRVVGDPREGRAGAGRDDEGRADDDARDGDAREHDEGAP